jgi:hypothetical protein
MKWDGMRWDGMKWDGMRKWDGKRFAGRSCAPYHVIHVNDEDPGRVDSDVHGVVVDAGEDGRPGMLDLAFEERSAETYVHTE